MASDVPQFEPHLNSKEANPDFLRTLRKAEEVTAEDEVVTGNNPSVNEPPLAFKNGMSLSKDSPRT